MAEENNPQVDEKSCLHDEKPMEIIEETYVETMPLMDETVQGEDVILPPAEVSNEINHVNGALNKRVPGKAQVQTRYRGNQMSSTHDLCKHGKRREDDLVTKPWKLVKKKNIESGDLGKAETLCVTKPEKSLQVAKKREEASSKSCDVLRVKRVDTKSTTTTTTPSDAAVVRNVKKTNIDVKMVSKIGENKSSKELVLKNLKNKEKAKIDEPVRCEDVLEKKVSRISVNKSTKEDLLKSSRNKEKGKIDEPVKCEDVLEKTLYVVEASIEEKEEKKKKSIKSVKSEIQQSTERRILRGSGKKSLTLLPSLSPSSEEVKGSRVTRSDPRPIRKTTSMSKIGLSEKKEIVSSAKLATNAKTESKIRPKRIGLKVTPPPPNPTRQMNFKKGKVVEPKPEDSSATLIKFKKRVVQEPKLRNDVNKKKKNLKDKGVGKTSISIGEGKREKVVLRHRKVEAKKKLQTLFNNVIEETVNKLEEVRKSSKVKALVGAFETVISLQDDKTKTPQKKKKKIQSTNTTSQVVEA